MPTNQEGILREKLQAVLAEGKGKLRIKILGAVLGRQILRFQEKEDLSSYQAARRLGVELGQYRYICRHFGPRKKGRPIPLRRVKLSGTGEFSALVSPPIEIHAGDIFLRVSTVEKALEIVRGLEHSESGC